MENLFEKIREQVPEYVIGVADILLDSGFQAYLVGGAAKDILLNREPKDYDLATNALPEQILELFPHSVSINAKFGTVLVIVSDKDGERFDVEVTTYRKEEEYFGGRWPAKVEFTQDIIEDLSRRDFTINAIAINLKSISDPSVILEEVLLDPFFGQRDLQDKIIRAVGDPIERFSEDGLRAYRACRFAAELDFEIESKTMKAIGETLHVARKVSLERVRDELNKLLQHAVKPSRGIELLRKSGLLELFLPELLELMHIEQPKWHVDDAYHHSLKTMDIAEDGIKLAALLHDIGKARTLSEDETGVHFYGHDQVGAEMVREIMSRLRYPKKEIDRVAKLVRWHMFYYPSAEWRKEKEINEVFTEENKFSGGWSDSAIRRFIKNVGEELIEDLFKLRIADAAANPKSNFDPKEIVALQRRISGVRQQDMALKVTDLNISGNDLQSELGIKPGPEIGNILDHLLDQVLEDPLLNRRDKLLELAKAKYLTLSK